MARPSVSYDAIESNFNLENSLLEGESSKVLCHLERCIHAWLYLVDL